MIHGVRWCAAALTAVLLTTGLAGPTRGAPTPVLGAAPPAAGAAGGLTSDGRWLVDGQGRVVLVHGVNIVYKKPPWLPPEAPGGFTDEDADFLASNGFNAVRLGVELAGLMPERGRIDVAYLDRVERLVQMLAERRIWVLLDFHQDIFTQWPDWAVPWNKLVPDDRRYGFPGNYFLSLYINAAYDNLWNNTNGVWREYRAAWTAVARRFARQPYLLGYDLMNEPWPGTQWPACISVGCPQRDEAIQRFQENAAAGIREVDQDTIVWFEPTPVAYVMPSSMGTRPVADPKPGFTWHAYCGSSELAETSGPDCPVAIEQSFANATTTATRMKAPLLLGEFGNTDDPAGLSVPLDAADRHLVGWLHWAYKGYANNRLISSSLFEDDNDLSSFKPAKADVLVRPFPRATAGVPSSLTFDPATDLFRYAYATRAGTAPGAKTEIFIPSRHYPGGYRATVTGGRVTSEPGASVLTVVADAGADRVEIEVIRS